MQNTSPKNPAKKTHTITIQFAEPDQWEYPIDPPQRHPKKAKVKRKDMVQWTCAQGQWKVVFKGNTPLADAQGNPLSEISGASGATAGGTVVEKVGDEETFKYDVKLILDGSGEEREEDPEIVIEA